MKYGLFTIRKKNLEEFGDVFPEYVLRNCGKKGCFMIGAADEELNLVGMTQFCVGMLENGELISDIIYIYVDEKYRRNGAASRMLAKVHSILKKSKVEKSLAFLEKKKKEKALFTENGYIFMKAEKDPIKEFEGIHEKMPDGKTEQGIYWINA